MRIIDGWLEDAVRVPTPNADERPSRAAVDLVVIHNISLPPGRYGGGHVQALFANALDPSHHPYFNEIAGLRVSAHLLIERDGRTTQFADFGHRAWHAGKSEFQGRDRCNDFSVGIELEGSDFEPFTDAQYAALDEVLAALCSSCPVRAICGHSDIAPGRKTDPGPFFDWNRVRVPATVAIRPARA